MRKISMTTKNGFSKIHECYSHKNEWHVRYLKNKKIFLIKQNWTFLELKIKISLCIHHTCTQIICRKKKVNMTFCTSESFTQIVTLTCLFSADNFTTQKLIHFTAKKGKSQSINANKAHEKVYFNIVIEREKKSFSFPVFHRSLFEKQQRG